MKPSVLRENVALELDYLQQTIRDVEGLLEQTGKREPTVYDRAAGAMLLAQFYNGVENILEHISKFHSIELPRGERSHVELFRRFCDPPSHSLPLLFPAFIEESFVILRRFRHFVRHSYAFQVDWERLRAGMETLASAFQVFKDNVESYLNQAGTQHDD